MGEIAKDASARNSRSSMDRDAVTRILKVCMSPRVGSYGYIYVVSYTFLPGLCPLQYIFCVYLKNVQKLALRIANYKATSPPRLPTAKRIPLDTTTMRQELNSDLSVFCSLGPWCIGETGAQSLQTRNDVRAIRSSPARHPNCANTR